MAKFSETKYVPPVATERPNPFIDALKQYADKGIGTAFQAEFIADEYKAEKLLIQKAVNAHGFSAREVQTNWDDELSGKFPVKSTFLIRPARKPRGSGEAAEAE